MNLTLLQDALRRSAERLPDKIALVSEGKRLSYEEIDRASDALARALVESGVARGDRVVVFAHNTHGTVIAFWAVLKANAVVSVVNPSTKAAKLAYLLEDCQARALITDVHLAEAFLLAIDKAPNLQSVFVSGDGTSVSNDGRLRDLDAVIAEGDAPTPPRRSIDVDLASIIYTSGSTGEPKGVMLTHRNMLAAARSITSYLENTQDDVILNVLPLSFDYGLYQMIMATLMGARLVLERSFAYPARVFASLVEHAVTGFPGVPTLFAMMAQLRSDVYDLSSVRYVTNTAAALSEKHIESLSALFPRARIYSMYGLTECKRCTYLPPEDLERKPGSVGIAIPNTELWLVDENDHRLGPNVVGQLVIRGGTVMAGYWGKPEATKKKLRPGPIPGESVLYTGDLCRLDDEGYLYFVGRMDEVIKSRGEKVAPKEVENAIGKMQGVAEAAVIGVDDDVLGQAIKAFVVAEPGATLHPKQVLLHCQSSLESFMVPKQVEILNALPKTANGKVDKQALLPANREGGGDQS